MKTIVTIPATVNEPLQEGDTFVYFSKYGGDEVYGEVASIGAVTCKSKTLNYLRVRVTSTKGNVYELGEVFKVTKKLTEEEQVRREKAAEEFKNLKSVHDFTTWKEQQAQIILKKTKAEEL